MPFVQDNNVVNKRKVCGHESGVEHEKKRVVIGCFGLRFPDEATELIVVQCIVVSRILLCLNFFSFFFG